LTDLEALELLQERARKFARPLQIAAGFATLGIAGALWGLLILVQWAIAGVAEVKFTALAIVGVTAAVVPWSFNRLLKAALARKRLVWIDELARAEGVRREVLLESFTLDSW
jgi:hypothetical protein